MADAPALGAGDGNIVEVQVLSPAQKNRLSIKKTFRDTF
jgi:hypothetical protein